MAVSISATMLMTLDGVVQAPGRADEDTGGGFAFGGWAAVYSDEVLAAEMGKGMAHAGAMVFGRRTWQDFITAWASATDGNPFTTHMNAATKYVVSRSLTDACAWENSVLLRGIDDVAALDGPLSIVGSAALVRSLHAAGLVDHYTLVIHPLTLGSGARLFSSPAPMTEFSLTGSVTTTKGVIVAHYARVSPGAR
ncbi:deaminase [Lentzea aerocolonigenes]|uniref:Deaminase n=1 Tax=Lentzea aerocolonigenes TaxID=68170 RepID=A0A0F0GCS4_LENAE|nr:dihydrofolate reductase family protein [Lentzea aerocolonigenes]KJK34270.1 deaminase [Lentzea aerocolonigenes]